MEIHYWLPHQHLPQYTPSSWNPSTRAPSNRPTVVDMNLDTSYRHIKHESSYRAKLLRSVSPANFQMARQTPAIIE